MSMTGEIEEHKVEPTKGDWVARSRAWMSILMLVPFAAVTIFSAPLVPEETAGDFVLDGFAWTAFALGAAFRWWATLYIGGRKHRELVTTGPYSICRNPLYFGTMLLTLSVALFLHSIIFTVGIVVATIFYLQVTVPYEEAQLGRLYGDPFTDYCARVPRFLPNPWLFESDEVIQVRTEGLWAETLRTLCWVWIPVLAEGAAHLRMESYWPKFLPLP
jgi:protein-S-isoprenylcysteine O-methyltransferase Ste14